MLLSLISIKLHLMTWATDLLIGSICTDDDTALFISVVAEMLVGMGKKIENWSLMHAAKHIAEMIQDVFLIRHHSECTNQRV
uniref:Uncharacterized protein n=1 Tax=Arundo donax TaxID=35708 RepID=A0A0A9GKF5_ARUDO